METWQQLTLTFDEHAIKVIDDCQREGAGRTKQIWLPKWCVKLAEKKPAIELEKNVATFNLEDAVTIMKHTAWNHSHFLSIPSLSYIRPFQISTALLVLQQ